MGEEDEENDYSAWKGCVEEDIWRTGRVRLWGPYSCCGGLGATKTGSVMDNLKAGTVEDNEASPGRKNLYKEVSDASKDSGNSTSIQCEKGEDTEDGLITSGLQTVTEAETGVVEDDSSYYLITVRDPVSRWLCADLLSATDDGENGQYPDAKSVAEFILQVCCSYGFLQLELVNFHPGLFDQICLEYRNLHSSLCEGVPEMEGTWAPLLYSQADEEGADEESEGLSHQVETLVRNRDWVRQFNNWILRQRIRPGPLGLSPFLVMFRRDIGISRRKERRKLQNSLLMCRHCHLTFTSKISFRIHQRRHVETARKKGEEFGELRQSQTDDVEESDDTSRRRNEDEEEENFTLKRRDRKRKTISRSKLNKEKRLRHLEQHWSQKLLVNRDKSGEVDGGEGLECDRLAESVQSLLVATNLERTRRGKYSSYTQDQRDEIAEYAVKYGHQEAANQFTVKYGRELSVNTVRSFCKIFSLYSVQLRRQIGEYAETHGIENGVRHFSQITGSQLSKATVRRFKRLYGKQRVGSGDGVGGGGGRAYSAALRQEIGGFAVLHGVEAAANLYSQKLQFPVKPSTVRKFKRLYGDRFTTSNTSTTIDLLHSSMNVLNQGGGGSGYYTLHYSTEAPHHPLPPPVAHVAPPLAASPHQPLPPPEDTHHQPLPLLTSGQLGPESNLSIQEGDAPEVGTSQDLTTNKPSQKSPLKAKQDRKQEKSRKNASSQERGSYIQYTAELRAKIGKYAAKHGNAAASRHFSAELGTDIPESTIRGMRDKYIVMSRVSGGGVREVACSVRGRPTSMGRYDQALMDTLTRLKEKGERVTSFAVIATAKQILVSVPTEELAELEDSVRLTPNWAKSILRRLNRKTS